MVIISITILSIVSQLREKGYHACALINKHFNARQPIPESQCEFQRKKSTIYIF